MSIISNKSEKDRIIDELLFVRDAQHRKYLSDDDRSHLSNAIKFLDVYGFTSYTDNDIDKALKIVKEENERLLDEHVSAQTTQARISLSNTEGKIDASTVRVQDEDTHQTTNVLNVKKTVDNDLFTELTNVQTNMLKSLLEGLCVYLGSDITPIEYENHISSPIIVKGKYTNSDTLQDMDNNALNIKPMGVGLISVNGLSFLLRVEGWSGGDSNNKQAGATATHHAADPMNVITVGPGVTNYVSKEIVEGRHFTFAQIMNMYSRVLVDISNSINRICPNITHISQRAIDMAISLAYNAGTSKLRRLVNCHNVQEVADVIYNGPKTAAGRQLKGLSDRRLAESLIVLGHTSNKDRNIDSLISSYMNPSSDAIEAMKIMTAR